MSSGAAAAAEPQGAEFFETRVRPLLARACYPCHTQSALGGLRVDSRAGLLQGGKSGPAITPGKPESSLLAQAVSHRHARLRMPPQGRLSPSEIADLESWIGAGAAWPESPKIAAAPPAAITAEQRAFWSFQPVRKPAVPTPRLEGWANNEIDRFILARLETEGVTPAAAADRRTLLRRVTFDLTGLPPTPAEMAEFLADASPGAFAKVVDRLLASPHYGERWGRHWLDLARYSDGQNAARDDTPYANAFRYRDWVVEALNRDLPYDAFVKAQLAADLLPEPLRQQHRPALGFQTLGESEHDRVDVTTRVFLGLTVGCAQCHDHKFDPVPTRDYYALLGVFRSSEVGEYPLVPEDVVDRYKKAKQASDDKKAELKRFLDSQTRQVADILASRTADYVVAAWRRLADPSKKSPEDERLDEQTLERWMRTLKSPEKEHAFFEAWFALMRQTGGPASATEEQVRGVAATLHRAVQEILAEKKALDDRNYVKLGGLEGMKDEARQISTLVDALPVEKYYFWRDLASGPYRIEDLQFPGGIYYYGAKDVERFLGDHWKRYLGTLRAESKALEKNVPPPYPFWHVLKESPSPKNARIAIRGNAENPGEEAPRRFLTVLCQGEPLPLQEGSGRLQLAEAIASPANPLTARVMVNRLWQHHFGEGIVRSASNFGQLGDRPSHPELLDHLAARLVESGWSLKAMHRLMLLSKVYQLSSDEAPAASAAKDPGNQLFWRAPVRERLEAESLRDATLAVAGTLDPAVGGPASPLSDDLRRRTLYATVSRGKPDRTMALFDFPDANSSAEQRITTVGPMQRLFFMNSGFVARQSAALADRLGREASDDRSRIVRAYELLYGRPVTEEETRLGLEFLGGRANAWPQYAQVLLAAAEFSAVK